MLYCIGREVDVVMENKTKQTLKEIKPMFKKIYKSAFKYIKNNILFFTFLLTSVLSATLVQLFTLKTL